MIAEEEAQRKKSKSAQRLANARLSQILNEDSEYYMTNKDITDDPNMTDQQKQLLLEIREKFKPDDIVADLCILYEVTQYKDESAEPDFWEQYQEFAEADMVDALVRKDKLKAVDARELRKKRIVAPGNQEASRAIIN